MKDSDPSWSRFLAIWSGQFLSRIGSGISAFALGIHLLEQTGRTSVFALLLLTAFLPPVLLAPAGGVIADRRDRRLLMIIADLGSAAGILTVIGILVLNPGVLWPLFAGVGLSSLFTALLGPSFKASISDLLDENRFSRASGLIQLAEASQYLLAPAIAAMLITHMNLISVLTVDMATFIIAAFAVLSVRKSIPETSESASTRTSSGFFKEAISGFKFVIGRPRLRRLLGITTMITFLVGVLQVLFTPMILAISDASTLGKVQSLAASGMLISSLVVGLFSRTDQQGKILSIALTATGACFFLIGFNSSLVLITLSAFGFFLALPFVNTSLEVLFRLDIESNIQGRAWSVVSLITQAGTLVALAITGILADAVFNPLLVPGGILSGNLGRIMGTGSARGSGLMVMLAGCGIAVLGIALTIQKSKVVKPRLISCLERPREQSCRGPHPIH